MTRGFTLIETMMVVFVITTVSLMGVNTITEFQKKTVLNGTANEFASTLRSAKNKSMTGEVLGGETVEDFEPDGLPVYGVEVDIVNQIYFLFREYRKLGDTDLTRQKFEIVPIQASLSLTPSSEVLFNRKGEVDSAEIFTLQKDGSSTIKQVVIDDRGFISIKDL